jgi:hypothetical protein
VYFRTADLSRRYPAASTVPRCRNVYFAVDAIAAVVSFSTTSIILINRSRYIGLLLTLLFFCLTGRYPLRLRHLVSPYLPRLSLDLRLSLLPKESLRLR